MIVAVFGATGGTGREIVRQALEAGHEVRASVRNPDKLGIEHDRLQTLRCDVLEPDQVSQAVASSAAVCSALGAASLARTDLYSRSMRNIVDAMRSHGVRRLLCVAAVGVEPVSLISLTGKLVIRFLLKNVLENMREMQDVVRKTDLDWTVMWPPRLSDGERTETYRIAFSEGIPKGSVISRADLAHYMIGHLEDPSTFQQKVSIAY